MLNRSQKVLKNQEEKLRKIMSHGKSWIEKKASGNFLLLPQLWPVSKLITITKVDQ